MDKNSATQSIRTEKRIQGQHSRSLTLGVSAALISIVLFSTMDATIKWLGPDYPVHQIMFFRCAVALIPVLMFLRHAGGIEVLKTEHPWLHIFRSVVGLVAMTGAFYGFTVLPLADASSVFYTAPLFAIAFSAPILGERVGIRRWLAVLVGLVGVLIIIRPSGEVFNLGGLSMLIAAVLVGLINNVIRKLNATDHAICITFYFTISSAVVTTIACLFLGWVVPNTKDLVLLMCVGLLGGSAQYAMTLSFRYAEVGIIAPFKYLSIVVGGVLGFVIWSETPDIITLVGIAIIILCGIYSMHREAVLARENDKREQMEVFDQKRLFRF